MADTDQKERAMYKTEYPEWGRMEAMLWAVYEWCQNRPAGEDMLFVD
jgi:hypothetical protein